MKEIKTFCDHCGKMIDEKSDYDGVLILAAYKEIETDLCVRCFEQLFDQICDYCKGGDGGFGSTGR